jgi:hypothetical protein
MLQAVASKLPLATIAEYLRDPAGYEPVAAFERALARYGAEVVEALGDEAAVVEPAADVATLVDRLALGVDAKTAKALLAPFA